MYTYEQLSRMNVAELRTIADGIEHEAVKGHLTMHKDKLLPALCTALGIDAHIHHHVVGTFNKATVKKEIRALKVKRAAALESHDYVALAQIRQSIHDLKHDLRRHIV